MSEQEFRFPTAPLGIPIYPDPGIYETIEISRGNGSFFDHATIEHLASLPTWDERRIDIEAEVRLRVARILIKRQQGDRTKVGPTPARR